MDLVTPPSGLIFWQLSGLVYFGFWTYALFDCVKNEFRGLNQKLIWLMLILFAPIIGTFLYLSMSKKTKEKRMFNPDFDKNKN
ncbi:phospholipase D-like protein [Algoriphagus boseongensis]|uniref:Phospholipase D-like protein n=1 Tax=Algoriphagus boseongensis TaxID=1442587 RepID=A0A4R6T7D2_9BACT|nr:PLD nuclease N-terminal domain-containing protein [Algoriphagus boseongensis]TDQ17135.1 phospholipase D-like protein [Algoriphagus boseongensis]